MIRKLKWAVILMSLDVLMKTGQLAASLSLLGIGWFIMTTPVTKSLMNPAIKTIGISTFIAGAYYKYH